LPLRLPAQKVAVIVGMLVALLYVLLAGFGVPAQRTLYMLVVVGIAFWRGRIVRVSVVLCLALALVLLLDPWSLMWPGFWLSFGAVACCCMARWGACSRRRRWRPRRPASTGRRRCCSGSRRPAMRSTWSRWAWCR
jgi:ComEC/Rec2-related protein